MLNITKISLSDKASELLLLDTDMTDILELFAAFVGGGGRRGVLETVVTEKVLYIFYKIQLVWKTLLQFKKKASICKYNKMSPNMCDTEFFKFKTIVLA